MKKILFIILALPVLVTAQVAKHNGGLGVSVADSRYVNIDGDTMTGQLNGTSAALTGSLTASTLTVTGANFSVGGSTLVVAVGKVLVNAGTSYGRLGQAFETNTSANYGGMAIQTWSATAAEGPLLDIKRSKSATIGNMAAVANGDFLGAIVFRGTDGTAFKQGASIASYVDGVTGSDDLPTSLRFETAPDGAASTVERMRITNGGNVGIGITAPNGILHMLKSDTNSSIYNDEYNDADAGQAEIYFRKSAADSTLVISTTGVGDNLGSVYFQGVNTAGNFALGAGITAVQSVAATATRAPADIQFLTANSASVWGERMRITSEGNVGISTTGPVALLEVNGQLRYGQYAATAIATLAPTATGNVIMCTTCTNPYTICASTHASAAGSWIIAGSAGSAHCQ